MDNEPIDPPSGLRSDAPLAPLTTLELGGRAAYLATATTVGDLVDAVRWAAARGLPLAVVGGGSNLVVADDGFAGVVLHVATRGVAVVNQNDGGALVTAAAGEPWDDLVSFTVADGLAGLECLSGIPGSVGATPIQNVGAYGVEVGEVIAAVDVLDRVTGLLARLGPAECAFAYRWSRFRAEPERFVVVAVTFRLARGPGQALRYHELAELFPVATPPPAEVREEVLGLRRRKSMVVDPADPNRRSVGSFFVNPVVTEAGWERLVAGVVAAGVVARASDIPAYEVEDGRKVPAGWLVEAAGFRRGLRRGAVGLSSNHALCLVHHGGGRTADLLELARDIRDRVEQLVAIRLRPEPAFLGFATPPL